MGLFSASARENITYGGDEEYALKNDGTYERTVTASRDEDIWEAAEEASARDFIETLPDKLETHVTDRILSGGQRQRLALARAFLRRPTLLVLDEATSALDRESERAVQRALDKAMRNKRHTCLIIAHLLSTVRHADKIIVLGNGGVLEEGTHEELMAREGGAYRVLVLGKDKEKGKKTGGMGRFGILLEDDTDTGEGREDDDEEEAK